MYADYLVDIPEVPGVYKRTVGERTTVCYKYEDVDSKRGRKVAHTVTIGLCPGRGSSRMYPNEKFGQYLPQCLQESEAQRAGSTSQADAEQTPVRECSTVLKLGAYLVLGQLSRESGMDAALGKALGEWKDLMLDRVFCQVLCADPVLGRKENDFDLYAWNHPLWMPQGTRLPAREAGKFFKAICGQDNIWSDARSRSRGSAKVSGDKAFMRLWSAAQSRREPGAEKSAREVCVYLNAADQLWLPGEITWSGKGAVYPEGIYEDELLEGLLGKWFAVVFDAESGLPLLYLDYFSETMDAGVLRFLTGRMRGYGYENITFLIDRGDVGRDALAWVKRNDCGLILVSDARYSEYLVEFWEEGDAVRGEKKRAGRAKEAQKLQSCREKKITGQLCRVWREQEVLKDFFLVDCFPSAERAHRSGAELTALYQKALMLGRLNMGEPQSWKDPDPYSRSVLWIPISCAAFEAFLAMILRSALIRRLQQGASTFSSAAVSASLSASAPVSAAAPLFAPERMLGSGGPLSDRELYRIVQQELEHIEICQRADGSYELARELTPEQEKLLQAFGLGEKEIEAALEEITRREKGYGTFF